MTQTIGRARAKQLELLGEASAEHTRRAWRGAVRRTRSQGNGPSPVAVPWDAVILGIDCASRSGWSRYLRGELQRSGELNTKAESAIRAVIGAAVEQADSEGVPCVLVLEQPYGGNVFAVAGIGRAQERWERVWREVAVGHLGKIIRVPIPRWRSIELGPDSLKLERKEVRPVEVQAATELLCADRDRKARRQGVEVDWLPPVRRPGPDEAPAILIGHWATRAGELAKLLGKRARVALLRRCHTGTIA